jgi:uncharacterized protein
MTTASDQLHELQKKAWLPYVLPFGLFLLLTEPARFFPSLVPLLYTTKTILVGGLLWFWRDRYKDDFSVGLSKGDWLFAIACGLLVLVIWIAPEHYFYKLGGGAGFDPYTLTDSQNGAIGLIAIRLIGASLLVPVMEELFWRSFLMRYLINPEFRSVSVGTFTWFSFLGVAILFGFEHHRIIVGIIAGLIYGLLLIRQKNLKGVIIAHGVTNLGLGIYVVITGNWMFW